MLTDVYFPRVNGVSASMRTLARELTRLGHEVTIVAPDYGIPHRDSNAGFEIIRLPARVIFFDPEDRLMSAHAVRKTVRDLAQRSWDVIHIHTPFRAHQLGVRLSRVSGCPVVESYHTFFEQYAAHYLPWLPAPLLRLGARRFSRRLCDAVDHLIVPTRQMADVLTRYGITTPASIIPTGIHMNEFRGGDGASFRRVHGIEPDQPTLVTVSRLAAEKNIGFLLDVAKHLTHEFPRLVFIVAGEGPDAVRLRARADALGLSANMRFVGNLDRSTTLLDCYRAGDAFVFASPTETQGLVLIEAMALGVPIVSTAVMGTATVLENAQSALVSPADETEFAERVGKLLRSPELRRALSSAGPRDAQAWSAPALSARVVETYAALAALRPASRPVQRLTERIQPR